MKFIPIIYFLFFVYSSYAQILTEFGCNEILSQNLWIPLPPNNSYPASYDVWNDSTDLKFSLEKKLINIKNCFIHEKPQSFDSLIYKLNNIKFINEKYRTIYCLGMTGNENVIPILENILLSDTNFSYKERSAQALSCFNSKKSIPVLIKASKDKNLRVRLACAYSLAKLDEIKVSFKIFQNIWLHNCEKRADCHNGFLIINSNESINFLRNAANYKNPIVALDAAIVLAQLGYNKEAFKYFQKFILNKNQAIQIAALYSLAYYIGDEKSFNIIKNMKKNGNNDIQIYCDLILSKFYRNKLKENK